MDGCVCWGGNLNNIRITDYWGVCVCVCVCVGGNVNNIRITDYRGGWVCGGGGSWGEGKHVLLWKNFTQGLDVVIAWLA